MDGTWRFDLLAAGGVGAEAVQAETDARHAAKHAIKYER